MFLTGLSKLRYKCPVEHFSKKLTLLKIQSNLSEEMLFKTAFYLSSGSFLAEKFFVGKNYF